MSPDSRRNYQSRTTVRYADLDAMGHVNYASYLSYCEDALNIMWADVLKECGLPFEPHTLGYVTAHADIDYLAPAFLGEMLETSVVVSKVGRRSFTTTYEVRSDTTAKLVVRVSTVQVISFPETSQHFPAVRQKLQTHLPK